MSDQGNYNRLFSLLHSSAKEVDDEQNARQAIKNKAKRDAEATNLFSSITQAYERKLKANSYMKKILFVFSLSVLIALVVAFIICLFTVINSDRDTSAILAILIPAAVSITTSVISIITVIAKYLFPQKEDKYFIQLVEELNKRDYNL